MKDLSDRAMNLAQLKGAEYADIRIVNTKRESIELKNQIPEVVEINQSQGFGIRVLYKGSWGFSASSFLNLKNIEKAVKEAIKTAQASLMVQNKKVRLTPAKKIIASYETEIKKDPFEISLDQKLKFLLELNTEMQKVKGVKIAKSFMNFSKEEKIFASTEGSFIKQKIIKSGAGIEATAISQNDVQIRSFPNSFQGQCGTAGYELVEKLALKENSQRIGEEAVALLKAPQCPAGKNTLILDSNQLYLQIHESCGHPVELDRVLGTETSFAGTSFLTLEKLGKFKYGSDIVNIFADATLPEGLGTFGYDDEGVPAQKFPIIKNGRFVNYLTSRETASALGQQSNGTMRADGWSNIPLIRMTNINLEPGEWELDALIADTKSGIFMSTNKAWSIDDKRLNFQFGCEIAWEIKNGKLGKIYKNPIYSGITPQFWNSCDAICNKKYWRLWGTPNCGKGEPMQMMGVAHGCSPARFRNVKIGVGNK